MWYWLIGAGLLLLLYCFVQSYIVTKVFMELSARSLVKEAKKKGVQKPFLGNMVVMEGEITEDKVIRVIREIMWLEKEVEAPEINILLDSIGGSIVGSHAICKAMKKSQKSIVIRSYKAFSSAALVLANGTKGKRFIYDASGVFIHNGHFGSSSKTDFIVHVLFPLLVRNMDRIEGRLLSGQTGQPFERLLADRKNETVFTAEDAVAYGFADNVFTGRIVPLSQK
ncbi:ATP-dependent Clp protease proteolytic subunit [Patescibacteria group bacterium AH-259-L05]|nr:ATP-dependent Clp protease proteolytic subunit [Patescibacteria group bacterium AH-259-L05]